MVRDHEDDAVAAAYQFSVGGGILILLISTALTATQELGSDDSANRAALEDVRSEALLGVALSSSWGWSEGDATLDSGFVALDGGLKMEAMTMFKGAQWTGLSNEAIDYSEAQAQWGLSSSEDFHLRIVPIDSTTIYDLSGLRVAYVAPWQDVATIHVDAGTEEEVKAAAQAKIDLSMADAATEERAILSSLGVDFDDQVHITANTPTILVDVKVLGGNVVTVPLVAYLGGITVLRGDVFLADEEHLQSSMAPHWGDYDVVVIGSGVDPEALAQGSFPTKAREHVEDGGLLVLLGGTEDTAWLEDIVEDAEATANQQRRTPDLSHPILTWPAPAHWQELDDGPAIPAEVLPDEAWQHILADDDHIDLAVSQQGALEDGMGIVTSLQPEGAEGRQLLLNMLAYYARQDLFLDFGQPIPEDVSVAGSERVMWGTDAGDNQVALRVQMMYWGQ